MYILVDCNNFFVSCERLFNPFLENRPVVILSNNDGCIISRSQEAKKLGVRMGEPYFKCRELCERQGVVVHSSNFELYGDISRRVMDVLADATPDIEIYSIDEAFLRISAQNFSDYCREIRSKIKQWIGIPVSLGIGPTKTLAKMANILAKTDPAGIFDLSSPVQQEEVLAKFPIGDIWGIGRRWEKQLRGLGLFTAKTLRDQDLSFIRKQMGAVGERLVLELRGISCLGIEEEEAKKSITSSRSFGKRITEIQELGEAISTYTANACRKLRAQGSCTQAICVYVEIRHGDTRSVDSRVMGFPHPTNDTLQIITAAKRCILQLFRAGEIYKKCGITLFELSPENALIPDLFEVPDPKRKRLTDAIDAINAGHGKNTVFYGAMGINPQWKTRCQKRTARYTTSWDELPIVS